MKITELYAWIVTEKDGTEGIPAQCLDGVWYPAVGADCARIESLRPIAADMQIKMGLDVKLVRFSQMTVVERLEDRESVKPC